MNVKTIFFALTISSIILFSCTKDDNTSSATPVSETVDGFYVLSEGGFGSNNSKLSFYNNKTTTIIGDFFAQQNPSLSGIGDVGNDMVVYGNKIFIAVNGSNNVTVLNAQNAQLLKRINFSSAIPKQPRYLAAARGKMYVTGYDNTVSVIDTGSLTIVKNITVGANPEGIAASANYLYVANSGGLNAYPDSTISLIDLNTETEIRKIKVGINPNKIEINQAGNIFVSAYGDYANVPPSISVINGSINTSSVNLGSNFSFSHIRIAGDIAYLYNNYGGSSIKVYNTATNTIVRNNFITDNTIVQTSYGLNVNEANGDVYITDAGNFVNSGKVFCFASNGVKKFSVSVSPGVNPNKVVFVK